uniref:ADP-ribosylation factor-like protein 10 n=1 Tax=Sus scrofa TaxID=9823 RepID=A0A480GBZ1_PIG
MRRQHRQRRWGAVSHPALQVTGLGLNPSLCSPPPPRHLLIKPDRPEPASCGPHLLVGHHDDRQVRVLVQQLVQLLSGPGQPQPVCRVHHEHQHVHLIHKLLPVEAQILAATDLQQVHLEVLRGQPYRVEAPGGDVAFQRWLPGQHAQERALPRAIQPQHQHLTLLQLLQRRLLVLLVLGLWGTCQAAIDTLPPDPSPG